MRRVLLAVAFCLVASTAFAQTPGEGSGAGAFIQLPNGDWVPANHPAAAAKPPFPLHGFVDDPHWSKRSEYFIGFPITGWMLDCRDGQQPPFVAIAIAVPGIPAERWIGSYTVERGLSRPDVRNQYAAHCPAIGGNDAFGYTLRINEPLPAGQHWLTVYWTSGDEKRRGESVAIVVK